MIYHLREKTWHTVLHLFDCLLPLLAFVFAFSLVDAQPILLTTTIAGVAVVQPPPNDNTIDNDPDILVFIYVVTIICAILSGFGLAAIVHHFSTTLPQSPDDNDDNDRRLRRPLGADSIDPREINSPRKSPPPHTAFLGNKVYRLKSSAKTKNYKPPKKR